MPAKEKIPRQPMPEQDAGLRARNFEEVPLGYGVEAAIREASRCLQCKKPACRQGCPVQVFIPDFIAQIGEGNFRRAAQILKEKNSLPGVCGRVCFHPCEAACNRGEYDEAVSIQSLERYLADHAWRQGLIPPPGPPGPSGRRIAIVGAGPAGLSAAYHLRRLGHGVDLFDAREEPGGMLRYAIPEYRLPLDALAWEVGLILNDGVRFHPGRRLGQDLAFPENFDDLPGDSEAHALPPQARSLLIESYSMDSRISSSPPTRSRSTPPQLVHAIASSSLSNVAAHDRQTTLTGTTTMSTAALPASVPSAAWAKAC
jgi:glutamate synthase (NADPH/NADH) small chain